MLMMTLRNLKYPARRMLSFPKRFYFLFLLICFAVQLGYGQTGETNVTVLELGKPIDRELTKGQKHTFKIVLSADEYAEVVVKQHGIDIAAQTLTADDKVIARFDSDPKKEGEEVVELISKAAGSFQITIEPVYKTAPDGRYEIYVSEIRKATEKEFALDEVKGLIRESNRLARSSQYDQAISVAEKALAISERVLGADDYSTGTILFALANHYDSKGDYDKAEPFFQRSLDIREKIKGKNHISLSPILGNFCILYSKKSDYAKAEALCDRALEIRLKELEPSNPLIAFSLNNLGILNRLKGDNVKAAVFYQRALDIQEKILGAEHPEVAALLNNIAGLYTPDVAKAEPLYRRALAIDEKVFGPEHPTVAQILYNFAQLYEKAGDFAKAKPLAQRSLDIREKVLGAEHPDLAFPLDLLGSIYMKTGDYAKAEPLFQRAIAIREKLQGQRHPYLGGALANLALLYAIKGDTDNAITTQTRANEILEYNIALNIATGSERQKLEYLGMSRSYIEYQTLTLNFQIAPNSLPAANLGVTTVLQRKGRVLDAMSYNLEAIRSRFNKQDVLLLDNLNSVTTQLAGLILAAPKDMSPDEHQKKIRALEEQRENLESEIGRRAGFYEPAKPVTLKAVQGSIPDNAALIEFAVYRPVASKAFEFAANAERAPRYVAYVVHKDGDVKWKDLGEARSIDETLDKYRQALRDPKRQDVEQLARAVNDNVIGPLRDLLGDSTQLLISPDGKLNLIPFEALVDENGRYLIERYSFSYLTSGRDLLRMQTVRENKNSPLIIANPIFGEPVSKAKVPNRQTKRRSITNARSMGDVYFSQLSGTAVEANSIHSIFPESTLLTGAEATESNLKQVSAPRLLHIATHGFFLEDAETSSEMRSRIGGLESISKIENPLLRSGLAFSGANQRIDGKSDGILTALEASALNLWGTKLVVLSACDTGLGEIRNGEGVYGLRRSFMLAGAESLLMSLWPVSDLVTSKLMAGYYKNLKLGMGRGEALRQVQLEMLKRPGRRHPFNWASFIQLGEWANLHGKR